MASNESDRLLPNNSQRDRLAESVQQENKNRIDKLRAYGGYSGCGKCPVYLVAILIFLVIHVFNIYAAFYTIIHNDNSVWCPSFEFNILVFQVQFLIMYLSALWVLNSNNVMSKVYKSYKRLGCKWICLLCIISIFAVIASILPAIDNLYWRVDYRVEIILSILDIYRHSSLIFGVAVLIGHFTSFPEAIEDFRNKQETQNFQFDEQEENSSKVIKFDHIKFQRDFKIMLESYNIRGPFPNRCHIYPLDIFILVLFIFYVITICLFCWTMVRKYFFGACKLSIWYYLQYVVEIVYFFVIWIIIAGLLWHSHNKIIEEKTYFIDHYEMDQTAIRDQRYCVSYLTNVIERKSPFIIFGKSVTAFFTIFTPAVFTILVAVYDQSSTMSQPTSSPTLSPTNCGDLLHVNVICIVACLFLALY